MNFPIEDVPFSRFGSYMSLNSLPKSWNHPGITVRSMRTTSGVKDAFNCIPELNGKAVVYTCKNSGSQLTLSYKNKHIDFCYEDTDVLRIRGRGLQLRIRSCSGSNPTVFPHSKDIMQVICPQINCMYHFIPQRGEINIDFVHHVSHQNKKQKVPKGDWFTAICGADGKHWELVIHDFIGQARPLRLAKSYTAAHKSAQDAWRRFDKKTPKVPQKFTSAAHLAMFVNYTSTVGPDNMAVKRNTMLMSKNWMCQCWSWDHCINAIAHAETDPDLAWDLFQGPFDHQNAEGLLPDSYSGGGVSYNFTKPPIHGWTLSCMYRKNKKVLNPKRVKIAEQQLTAWTNWWFKHRDTDKDGLPEYRHGNDSGWDNGTVFDVGYPMVSPDLPAYLILQMDMLAELAAMQKNKKREASWRKKSDKLLETMIDKLWTGNQFLAMQGFTGKRPQQGDSLLNHIAIILGDRLPEKQRKHLIDILKPDGRFITKNGPATESPQSELYGKDSYWRGPIWGPETVMAVDGLYRAGAVKQAKEIAKRFCMMCKKDNCMAENYNAETGKGLRDRAYTWGSSAFLFCASLLTQ